MINSTNTSPSRSNDTNSTSPSNNNNININNNKIGSSTSSPFKAPPGFIRNDVNSSPASFSSPQNTPKTLPSTNNSSPHLQNNNSAHNSQRSNSISTVLSNNSVPPISPRNSIVNNHLHDLRSGSTSSSNCVSTSPITSNYNYSYTTVNSNAVQRSPTFNHRNLSTGTPPLPITTVNTNNSMKRYSYSSGSAGGDNNPNSNSNANANANVNSSSVSGSSSSPQQYNSEQIFDLMEREQDAIVLKLMKEIEYLKHENKYLKLSNNSTGGSTPVSTPAGSISSSSGLGSISGSSFGFGANNLLPTLNISGSNGASYTPSTASSSLTSPTSSFSFNAAAARRTSSISRSPSISSNTSKRNANGAMFGNYSFGGGRSSVSSNSAQINHKTYTPKTEMNNSSSSAIVATEDDDDTMDASNEGTTKDTKKYKYTDYDKIIEENNSLKREIQTLKVKLEELERR